MIDIDLKLKDMVKDEYGNYYFIVKKDDNTLTLVNAFMEISFRQILSFDSNFINSFREYDKQYLGKFITDVLKKRIRLLEEKKVEGNIFNLQDIMKYYRVNFIPLYEKVII